MRRLRKILDYIRTNPMICNQRVGGLSPSGGTTKNKLPSYIQQVYTKLIQRLFAPKKAKNSSSLVQIRHTNSPSSILISYLGCLKGKPLKIKQVLKENKELKKENEELIQDLLDTVNEYEDLRGAYIKLIRKSKEPKEPTDWDYIDTDIFKGNISATEINEGWK